MRNPEIERRMVSVRLPVEVANWLDGQVVRFGSSQSSEVLRALRERMDAEQSEKAVR